jgi:predicted phage baseplate assembly protein
VSSTYRIGSGLAGQVKAGQISMLLTQVLGVKGVVNPLAAAGAADPEKLAEARRNAPLTILTFDRIVSLQDYEDFANAFAGIGKAQANMLWDGEQRLVHLTVAGADGRGVGSESELFQNLIDGIDGARHPEHRVIVDSFQPLNFDVKASVKIDAAYITEDVFQAITRALQSAFDFDSRSFGQAVTGSEVQACIQQVGGVAASFLEELYFTGENPELHARLPMNMNAWRVETNQAARLLTINPQGITLTKMTL